MKIRMIGLLIFLVAVVGAIICGGSWASFIDPAGIAYLLLVVGGLALIRFKTAKNQTSFFVCLKRYAIISGILGFLTGFLQMASHYCSMKTFNPAQIFAGFGVAVSTIFYALILYCVLDAFEKTDV